MYGWRVYRALRRGEQVRICCSFDAFEWRTKVRPYKDYSCLQGGSERMRLPVASKMALQSSLRLTVLPASPIG